MLKRHLFRKVSGFTGITHLLLAMTLFFLLLLFPLPFSKEFVHTTMSDLKYFIILLFIMSGAALIPDLDNDESTAGYQLGFVGSLIKVFMKTTAFMAFSLYHLKNDRKPKSMHRLLWHTPFVSICLLLYFSCFSPTGDSSFWDLASSVSGGKEFVVFIVNHTSTIVTLVAAYACGILGSNIILYWPMKLLPIGYKVKALVNNVVPLAIVVVLVTMPVGDLKYVGIAIGLGYLFHIIGDLISEGSVPVHWPIPWKGKAYNTPWILGPFQIRTGGIVNTLLNFVLLGINIFLLISLF